MGHPRDFFGHFWTTVGSFLGHFLPPKNRFFLTILGQKSPTNSPVGAGRGVGTAALPPPPPPRRRPWVSATIPKTGLPGSTSQGWGKQGKRPRRAGPAGQLFSSSQAVFGIVAETQGRRPPGGGRGVGPPCRPADPRRPCYFWDFFDPKWSKNRFFGGQKRAQKWPKNDPKMAKTGPKMVQKVTGVPHKIPNWRWPIL